MKRLVSLVAIVTAILLSLGLASAAGQQDQQPLQVILSTTTTSAITGDSFDFTSTVKNFGSEPTAPLVANLNFVSLDGKTFVDPEDWSHQRTIQIAPIDANSSVGVSWTVEPVLGGDVAVYVVILPAPYEMASTGPLAVSPALHVHVTERRALNPGGVLPVVLSVPAVLLVGTLGLRRIRLLKRHRV